MRIFMYVFGCLFCWGKRLGIQDSISLLLYIYGPYTIRNNSQLSELFLKFLPGKAINIENEIENADKMEDKKNRKKEEKFCKLYLCMPMFDAGGFGFGKKCRVGLHYHLCMEI